MAQNFTQSNFHSHAAFLKFTQTAIFMPVLTDEH